MSLTRRGFLVAAVGAVVTHHRPWHHGGPSPTPSPSPSPSPTSEPLGFYSDTYSETY